MNKPMMNPVMQFEQEKSDSIATYRDEKDWRQLSNDWMSYAFKKRYMYNFTSLGRPIIQTPVDMVAMQELIWNVKPDLVIETGIAHGGSLILSASMLALLDYCEAIEQKTILDPSKPKRRVIGIDIDIRAHNRAEMEKHPLINRIDMVLGSSTAPETVAKVRELAKGYKRVLVCLDSNHTHEHVLAELEAYAPMTSKDSYCIVFDTIVEDLPDGTFPDRPWKQGDNPKTAVWEYLKTLKGAGRKADDGAALNFEIDRMTEDKLVLSVAPDGYLRRT